MIAANHGHLVSIASCAGLCGSSQLAGSVLKLISLIFLNSAINIHGEVRVGETNFDFEFLDLSVASSQTFKTANLKQTISLKSVFQKLSSAVKQVFLPRQKDLETI